MSQPNGVICSQDDWELSQTTPFIRCLTRDQSIGLTLPVETGLLSLSAVLVVGVLVIRNTRRYKRKFPDRKWKLFQEPSDVFMVSLFIFDAAQAVGAIMDLKWIIAGKVFVGPFCSAQGAVQQLGEAGVAMTTLAIAVHTFVAIWWSHGLHATKTAWFIVALIWMYVGLFVIIGIAVHHDKATLYESPTPYWCWIGQKYEAQRVLGEYLWLWLTLFFSIAAYLPLFLWMRGNLVAGGRHWYSWSWRSKSESGNTQEQRDARKHALDMLAYPTAYCFIVLPLCVVRWLGFHREAHNQTVPSAATIAAVTLFGLSGIVNVLVFLGTRPDRLLFAKEPSELTEDIALPPSDYERPTSDIPKQTDFPGHHENNLGALLSATSWQPYPHPPGTGTTQDTLSA